MEQRIIDQYIRTVHEKRRAHKLGKPVYGDNCDIEIQRLGKEYSELVKIDCECKECQEGILLKDVKKVVWRPKQRKVKDGKAIKNSII